MKDKYVFDSSIWIEIERRNPRILTRVEPHLEKNEVCLVDLIVAEVLRGARGRRDFEILDRAFSDFLQLSTDWRRVAELGFLVARKGFTPPLADLYIAQCVHENDKVLLTQDRDFKDIARALNFKFELL